MILLIDNYDSFTYNLEQYLGDLGRTVRVVRNDELAPEDIPVDRTTGIVVSPGPGRPEDAGISRDVIRTYREKVPILGVCLGHQCIGTLYGSRVKEANDVVHGKTSRIHHDESGIFQNLENPFRAARYHSLVLEESSLSSAITVTARTADGTVMGIRHRKLPLSGIQFHPESILTDRGMVLLENFLNRAESFRKQPTGNNLPAPS